MRQLNDWLEAYVQYAGFTEAPKRMHFWAGVSALAGALRRRVWIDQKHFTWTPNFYIVLVAPPGVVSKSTTAGIAMDLLRAVPGIRFGPDVVTWQALVSAFADATEAFEYGEEWLPQSALTLESGEFGNLIDPKDPRVIDLFVSLWDAKKGAFDKRTKTSGNDHVENPWINLIGCTTPAWIAGNFPEYVIGGGFTSRCLFVYADKKERCIAYPRDSMPAALTEIKAALVQDLAYIAERLVGEYNLEPAAKSLGETWYKEHQSYHPDELDDDRAGGYLARKQTHIHKLAMILAASQRDDLIITESDLGLAIQMVTDLEPDMLKVFARIGRTEESVQAERLVRFVKKKVVVTYKEAYAHVHAAFPSAQRFNSVVNGAVQAGLIEQVNAPQGVFLRAIVNN